MPIRNLSEVFVPLNRIRREFPPAALEALINSILSKGLLHPPVVEKDGALLAGERRFRAITEIAERGLPHECNGKTLKAGFIHTTDIFELSPTKRLEAELEENTIRLDLSWQEKAEAVAALHKLRDTQKADTSLPGLDPPLTQSPRETAAEIRGIAIEEVSAHATRDVKADLLVAAWLHDHADAEVEKASSRSEALKIIERKVQDAHRTELARRFVLDRRDNTHILQQGDLLTIFPTIPDSVFDVILTDPPWGVGASEWTNGAAARRHTYADDSLTFERIHHAIAAEGYRVAKPKAHLYLFCASQQFPELASLFRRFGWDVWPRPLIWHKGANGGIAPRPEHGPRNTYECVLFANKGDKRILSLQSDVLIHPKDGRDDRAAEKPAALFYDLLSRSVIPGDEVLDPCCGTGPIFPAANALKVRATGYDVDEVAVGIASQRLKETFVPFRKGI